MSLIRRNRRLVGLPAPSTHCRISSPAGADHHLMSTHCDPGGPVRGRTSGTGHLSGPPALRLDIETWRATPSGPEAAVLSSVAVASWSSVASPAGSAAATSSIGCVTKWSGKVRRESVPPKDNQPGSPPAPLTTSAPPRHAIRARRVRESHARRTADATAARGKGFHAELSELQELSSDISILQLGNPSRRRACQLMKSGSRL